MTRPSTDTAKVVLLAQEKMILSLLTAPVLALTFSIPKNFCRAAIWAGVRRTVPNEGAFGCTSGAASVANDKAHRPAPRNADSGCLDFMSPPLIEFAAIGA